MKWFEKKRPFYRQIKYVLPMALLTFLVVLRVSTPSVLLSFINSKLKDQTVSSTLQGHVGSVRLSLLRGRVVLKDVTGEIKKTSKQFLNVDSVTFGVSWNDLLRGHLILDVQVKGADLTYSQTFLSALKTHAAEKKQEDHKKKESTLHVARVHFKDSTIRLDQDILVSNISGEITNLTPSKKSPTTGINIEGKLLNSGLVKTEGVAKLLESPVRWSVDSEILKFDLPHLNKLLLNKVPVSFTHGQLDLYVEAVSDGDKVKGYFKPFIEDLDVVKKKEDFKGSRHFVIEIITAIASMATKDSNETVATKVPFVFDGKFKTETGDAIIKAFENKFSDEIGPGIERSLKLK